MAFCFSHQEEKDNNTKAAKPQKKQNLDRFF